MRKTFNQIAGLLIMMLLIHGCGAEELPKALISEDDIIPVLKDLQIAYAGVDQTVRNPKHRPAKYQEMNELVLQKYEMDNGEFFDSYKWYQSHPEILDSIYQRVITELNIEIVPLQNKQKSRRKGGGPEIK